MALSPSSPVSWDMRVLAYLAAHGYKASVIGRYRCVTHRFLSYLGRRHVDLATARTSHVTSFLACEHRRFRRRHGREPRSASGWRAHYTAPVHLLFRLAQGSWPPPPPAPATPRERFCRELCDGFAAWMTRVRGLSALSVLKDGHTARCFLGWLGDRANAESLRELTPADLDAFLAWRAPGLQRSTLSGVCHGLRSFLRYLQTAGRLERDLAPCITNPSQYRNESLPSAFTDKQVKTLLTVTREDRSPVGRRDYAILLLLATYGLRAGEVVRLRLQDIDWRRERIRITQSKTGAESYLPLVTPVGRALLAYLQYVRPRSPERAVFLRVRAPYRPFSRGSSLAAMITRRLHRAGIAPAGRHGAHAFRYARAVSLLRASVPLKAISDLLGHRASSSTEGYLKLSTEDLRDVGLEVPAEVTS